jgi:hypothetical protein
MVEAALVMPLLLVIALNGLNFGYFFLVAINLVSAPRAGVQYSIEGFVTPAASGLPVPGSTGSYTSVSYLVYQDMLGALPSSSSTASAQICTKVLGMTGSGSSQISRCTSYGSASFSSPAADPEAPTFVANQVDVTYSFVPLVPGTYFNLALLPTGYCTPLNFSMTCTLHTSMTIRAMD